MAFTIRKFLSVIALSFALFASACANDKASQNTLTIVSPAGDEHAFNVEIADDDDERRIGLMFRTEMAADAGMLFDFEREQYISMWMKNTLIPLDMAFIGTDGSIKTIAANTTPQSLASISSGQKVIAVLEVNGGTFEKLGIKVGDKVHHPMFADSD